MDTYPITLLNFLAAYVSHSQKIAFARDSSGRQWQQSMFAVLGHLNPPSYGATSAVFLLINMVFMHLLVTSYAAFKSLF